MDKIIPDLIFFFFMIFYFQREFIATIGEGDEMVDHNFEISDDKRTVSLIDGCWGTLYGNIIIDSLSQIICRWDIKISSQVDWDTASSLWVGLCGDTKCDRFLNVYHNLPCHSFCADGYGKLYGDNHLQINPATTNWKENDIIGIKLDLEQRNVEYFVNDKSVGLAFKNIPIGENIKYRLMITMNTDGQRIDIESFESL